MSNIYIYIVNLKRNIETELFKPIFAYTPITFFNYITNTMFSYYTTPLFFFFFIFGFLKKKKLLKTIKLFYKNFKNVCNELFYITPLYKQYISCVYTHTHTL